MDESTYNNIYRNASPMTPSTPSTTPYQANVNRTKTRKWVEAKAQNYDGDDWGNEYYDDDEPDEPPPPPPSMGTGFRQPGQPGPGPGSRVFSQPAGGLAGRGDSAGFRSPSGPPALHVQTQSSNAARFGPGETVSASPHGSDPSSLGSPSGRAPLDQFASPQSSSARPYAPGPAYGRREYSPASQSRNSPVPQSAGPTPARFPPRKSSMGPQDMAEFTEATRPMSGSRPGSSSSARPWVGQRSSSPGYPSAPAATAVASAATPTKPLPFIRPADIYRRMEEEKEKVRRSMDSGRPSMDSLPGVGSERSQSPANVVKSPTEQRRRTSFEKDDGSDISRALKPTLAPVAERKSEYGLERFIDAAHTPINKSSTQEAASGPQEVNPPPPTTAPITQQEPEHPGTSKDVIDDRRMSVSPRLPDVARLSGFGFGDDFFSGPSKFSNPETSPEAGTSTTAVANRESQEPTSEAPSQINTAFVPTPEQAKTELSEPTLTNETEGPALSEEPNVVSPAAQSLITPKSAEGSSPPPNDTPEQLKTPRPSIPGGWVSETTNIDSETPTPMERPEPKTTPLSPIQDTEVSPVTDSEVEADIIKPLADGRQILSPEHTSKDIASAQTAQQPRADVLGDAADSHDQVIADEAPSAGLSSHPTPQTLPPLQTQNPLSTATAPPGADHGIANSAGARPSHKDSPLNYSATTQPNTATTVSEFVTAPLNPRRADVPPSEFVAPGMLPRNMTMTMSSIDTASPANENDQLRDDIIKSLSPVNPPSAGGFRTPPTTSTLGPSNLPDMTRESRYLSGVYDDYLGPAEEKSLQETSQTLKGEAHNLSDLSPPPNTAATAPPQATLSKDQTEAAPAAPLSQSKSLEPEQQVPNYERRFSWEQGPEHVTLSPVDESNTQILGTEASKDETKPSVPSPSSPPSNYTQTLPGLQVERDNSGTMSHQVSLVSSHAPGGLGAGALDPPSPISVMSAEKGPIAEKHVAGEPAQDRRMSLAEEKVLIQSSSNPVSPSPPRGEHPALSKPLPVTSPTAATVIPEAPASKQLDIMNWREILSMPSAELRVQKFEEARLQYSSMDSGLSNWIEHVKSQPEHAATLASLGGVSNGPLPGVSAPMEGQQLPASMHSPKQAQQPYYQQYLNASNPNIAAPPPGLGRASTGHLLSQQPSSSGFGPSGNQVGVKSKELLHAAGIFGNKATKSGMKLFNKGKSKLRGTGDKDYEDPEQTQQTRSTTSDAGKAGNERRFSWGVSVFQHRQRSSQGSKAGVTALPATAARTAGTDAKSRNPVRHAHSSSLSLIQYLVHRSPNEQAASPPPPAAIIGRGTASSKQQQDQQDVARARAASSVSFHQFHQDASTSTGTLASPPQLPPLGRLSPFNPASRAHTSSPGLPPRQPDAQRAASEIISAPRHPPQPELVSPISTSDTHSSTSVRRSINKRDDREPRHQPADRQLQVPAPISKFPPTWDPFTGTPLVEEEGFELDLPVQPGHSVPLQSSASPLAANDDAHLTTGDRSHNWVEVTPRPQLSASNIASSTSDPSHRMSAAMMAQRPNASTTQQYIQEEGESPTPVRQASFVGLPPIRRTSTFGIGGIKNEEGDSASEGEVPPVPSVPAGMNYQPANEQQQQPQYGSTQFYSGQPQPQGFAQQALQHSGQGPIANGQGGYGSPLQQHQQQPPNGYFAGHNVSPPPQQPGFGQPPPQQVTTVPGGYASAGQQQQFNQGQAGSPQHQFNQAQGGSPQAPSNSGPGQAGSPSSQGQSVVQPGARPGMGSPPVPGNPISRFPPQGRQWKLEESHLSEPLNSARKPNSPPTKEPGYYAYEKETESPVNGGPSQPPQRSIRNNGLPPVSAQRFPGLFPAGGSNQPAPAPASALIPQDQIQPHPQAQQLRRDSMGISRSSTQDFDDGRAKRNSGLFKEIGGKFMHRGRGGSVSDAAQDDDISETSVVTEEPREKKKRGSLFGIGNPLGSNGPQQQYYADDPPTMQSQQPKQTQQPQQFGPPEKKKTFFGAGALAKQATNLGFTRSDSASVKNEPNSSQGNVGGGGPKKRLSELKGIFKGTHKDDSQPVRVPDTAQSNRPSMQGNPQQPQGFPQQQSPPQQPQGFLQQGPPGPQVSQGLPGQPLRQPGQPGQQGPPGQPGQQGQPGQPGQPRQFISQLGPQGQPGQPRQFMAQPGLQGQPGQPGQQSQPRYFQGQPGQPVPPGQLGQAGAVGSPLLNRVLSNNQNPGQSQVGQPNFASSQNLGDDRSRKASTGGFLGSIFGNRPGSRAKDGKPQPTPMQPGTQTGQYFLPGQAPPPGQQVPHGMMYSGQPGFPQGQPGQGVPMQGQPQAQGPQGPMQQPGQRPAMPTPLGSQGLLQQPRQPGPPGALAGQPTGVTGQGVVTMAMRQPSQPSDPTQGQTGDPQQQFSSNQRQGLPSQQGSQDATRPGEHELRRPLSSNPINASAGSLEQQTLTAPQGSLSQSSSQEQLSVGGSSVGPRVTPSRKPVGSGPSRQDRGSVSTGPAGVVQGVVPAQLANGQASGEAQRSIEPTRNEQFISAQASSFQRSPGGPLSPPAPASHMRQPSLPTPSHSPAPPASPEMRRLSAQSNQPPASPQPQTSPHSPPQGYAGSPERRPSGQLLSAPQGQPGQPGRVLQQQPSQAGRGQPAQPGGLGPQQSQPWGFTRTGTSSTNMSVQTGQQPHMTGQLRPTPSQEQQKSTISMSKLFGKRRDSTSPQPPTNQSTIQRESTSAKFLSAFRRPSKQVESGQPQQRPPQGQQIPPQMIQGGRGQLPGQQIPPHLLQAGRGQMGPGGPTPQGMLGPAPGQPQGPPQPGLQGRGQVPPQLQAGRGQIPPQFPHMTAGRGQMPPGVMPGGRGQPPQQPTGPTGQPQYAAVPIPRGYEAVHGYGVPNMIAQSPYDVGRGSPQQQYGPPFQSMTQQPGVPPQQFDPRAASPAPSQAYSQYGQSMLSQQSPQQPPQHDGQPQQLVSRVAQSPAPQPNVQPLATQTPPPQNQFGTPEQSESPHAPPRAQGALVSPPSAPASNSDLKLQVQSVSPPEEDGPAHKPQRQHIVTAMSDQRGQSQVESEAQQHGSPQNYPLPSSANTFSPVNTAATRLPNPPLPPVESVQDRTTHRFTDHISQSPSPPTGAPTAEQAPAERVASSFSIMADPPRSTTLSPDVVQQRTFSVSPEPPGATPSSAHQSSLSNLHVNVERANSRANDEIDIYDATPRNAEGPRTAVHASTVTQESQPQAEHKPAIYNPDEASKSTSNGTATAGGALSGAASGAAGADVASEGITFYNEGSNEGSAQATPMEPEEKILVDQPVELAAVSHDYDNVPMMSATSYPGQEWNPYGAGEFGDYD